MSDWKATAAAKRQAIRNSIPKQWIIDGVSPDTVPRAMDFPFEKHLSEGEMEITGLSVTELLARLAKGRYKAVEVARAFAHRAAIAHQLVNCCLEFFWEAAEKQAQELDDYYAKHGKVMGPLHGLPISLKDQFRVKGVETSMGYVGWLGHIETVDSVFTSILRKLGAVFYVKTTVPQSLMCGETINNITGRTVNPHNNKLSCGGSSGGEGALIALRGSILGLATDIGGSIRIPAGFNGLCGIRPSHGRMPYNNLANSLEGQETIQSVVGPIAHTVADLRFLFKTIVAAEPWFSDPKCIEFPWRQERADKLKNRKLTFGIIKWDKLVMPHPPVQRGVKIVQEALKAQGHEIIEFDVPDATTANSLTARIYCADGGKDIRDAAALSGEPIIPNIEAVVRLDQPVATINEAWDLQLQRTEYQKKVLQVWNETAKTTKNGLPMDAFICPIAPFAAVSHGNYDHVSYTSWINLLDYPACVVPVTYADKAIDERDTSYQPISDLDKLVWSKCRRPYEGVILMVDDPEVYHGGPVALQLVGRRLREEDVLEMAEILETALKKA